MIGLPPLLAGAVQATVAVALPAVAVPIVGAPGAVSTAPTVGVTALEFGDAGPVPMAFVAVTVKWYVVPLMRPVTSKLVAAAPAGRSAPTCALAASSTVIE